MSSAATQGCRVCNTGKAAPFLSVGSADYWRCPVCLATFIDKTQLPSAEDEKKRYELHKNDPIDEGYRQHLCRLVDPLIERIGASTEGLDYGCGKISTLAQMLGEAGQNVNLYDPFFYPDKAPLEKKYDFITCSEVIEHFHEPAKEFKVLDRLLKPGGLLAVMTCFLEEDSIFADWYYRRDMTHVVFYKEETLRYIAKQNGWDIEIPAKDVAFFRKPRTK